MFDVKYRPLTFADVLGQEGSVQVLKARLRQGTALDTSYIFSGAYGSGKCVRGDTLVFTGVGLVPIEKLMGAAPIDTLVTTVVQEHGCSQTAYSYQDGVQKTVSIKTHYGYALEGTPSHRIRVLQKDGKIGWLSLGEVQKGDFACIVPRGLFGLGADLSGFVFERRTADHSSVNFTQPKKLDEDWGRLLGYLIGEGTCTAEEQVTLTNADAFVKEDMHRLLLLLGGASKETPDKRSLTGCAAVRCCRKQFRSFLAHIGLDYTLAGAKTVPWAVLASPEFVVRGFLQGYFESDGGISGCALEFSTKSEVLARQLQVLLLSFGIICSRRQKRVKNYGTYWRCVIKSTSLRNFRDRIGFISPRKQEELDAVVLKKHAKGKKRSIVNSHDIVPYQAQHVAEFYAGLPLNLRTRATNSFFQSKRGIASCTNRQVQRIVTTYAEYATAHFQKLATAGYFFDPVEEITQGECPVFDLNVPEGEMFAANGFMNHNTTCARILARSLLCQNLDKADPEPCNECESCKAFLDEMNPAYVELDAASNGTIDNVRAIVDNLAFVVIGGAKRIYLFDEIHRMSPASQDVLLKPIEEKKMVGIFCTTEPEKIRGTIRSRCEEYPIRKISRESILSRMRMILEKEGSVGAEDDAILTVIDYCDSHVRDVLNKLEMISQLGPVTLSAVREHLNLGLVATYYEILLALDVPARAVDLTEKACELVGPDDVAAGLAEAAMNAYRLAHNMYSSFVTVDRALSKKLYEKYGDSVVRLADTFSKLKYSTKISLVCAVLLASPCAGVPLPVVSLPVVSSALALTVPTVSLQGANAAVSLPQTTSNTVLGTSGKNPLGLSPSEQKSVPVDMPRGTSKPKPFVVTMNGSENADTPLPPEVWQREFERALSWRK